MKTWATRNGATVIELVHGRCNLFLVARGETRILVDTGTARMWPSLRAALEAAGAAKGAPLLVFLTHTHFDHAGNAARLKQEWGARLAAPRAEADCLRAGCGPLPDGTLPPTKAIVRLARRFAPRLARFAAAEPDVLVDDGLELGGPGFSARALHTPGHSEGSTSLVVDGEIALVGDAMFGVLPGGAFPPYAADPERLVASWGRLLETGCSAFLPAHGGARSRKVLELASARRKGEAPSDRSSAAAASESPRTG